MTVVHIPQVICAPELKRSISNGVESYCYEWQGADQNTGNPFGWLYGNSELGALPDVKNLIQDLIANQGIYVTTIWEHRPGFYLVMHCAERQLPDCFGSRPGRSLWVIEIPSSDYRKYGIRILEWLKQPIPLMVEASDEKTPLESAFNTLRSGDRGIQWISLGGSEKLYTRDLNFELLSEFSNDDDVKLRSFILAESRRKKYRPGISKQVLALLLTAYHRNSPNWLDFSSASQNKQFIHHEALDLLKTAWNLLPNPEGTASPTFLIVSGESGETLPVFASFTINQRFDLRLYCARDPLAEEVGKLYFSGNYDAQTAYAEQIVDIWLKNPDVEQINRKKSEYPTSYVTTRQNSNTMSMPSQMSVQPSSPSPVDKSKDENRRTIIPGFAWLLGGIALGVILTFVNFALLNGSDNTPSPLLATVTIPTLTQEVVEEMPIGVQTAIPQATQHISATMVVLFQSTQAAADALNQETFNNLREQNATLQSEGDNLRAQIASQPTPAPSIDNITCFVSNTPGNTLGIMNAEEAKNNNNSNDFILRPIASNVPVLAAFVNERTWFRVDYQVAQEFRTAGWVPLTEFPRGSPDNPITQMMLMGDCANLPLWVASENMLTPSTELFGLQIPLLSSTAELTNCMAIDNCLRVYINNIVRLRFRIENASLLNIVCTLECTTTIYTSSAEEVVRQTALGLQRVLQQNQEYVVEIATGESVSVYFSLHNN